MLSSGNTNSDDYEESDTEFEKAEFPKLSTCTARNNSKVFHEFPLPYRFQTQDDRAPPVGRPWWKKDKNH